MGANELVDKLKANGTNEDLQDLEKVHKEYKCILSKLSSKDRGQFSLNILCTLCRNLDKVPPWKTAIDPKDLLLLSIDCVRETRSLNRPELVKTLACVYHIHRFIVRQNSTAPPELILKLSFMPFEYDTKNLLNEYCKTYWNIIVDRLLYIEKIRGKAIDKLLPKLTEDILKIINIFDTVPFCDTILTFLVKKLHQLYTNSYPNELNKVYVEIFKQLSTKKDVNAFKKLKDEETLDIYVKLNDCFYVIAENAAKNKFKESALSAAVKTSLVLLGHRSDLYHCLQTFYLNSFCDIIENNSYINVAFKNILISCEMTKKLGYIKALDATYPFLNQLLRLFIEYSINNSLKDNFDAEIQEHVLNLMLHLMFELKTCAQVLKCDNCVVKTGSHDSLRLSFLLKHFITNSIYSNIDITHLTVLYNNVVKQQYNIINDLKSLGCANYEKFFRKLQTDTHNIAILLNKSKKYEFSIQLFDIYLQNELSLLKHEIELKNVSRALYNKGICELDCKLFEHALVDAFLGLVFSQELSTDKYMSLVMDIKAKALKATEDQSISDNLQMMTVYDACEIALAKNIYNLKTFIEATNFSDFLKHEFSMYAKLWPSISPIAGVWRSLNQLIDCKSRILSDENNTLWALFEIISETPSIVWTIHNPHFQIITTELLERIEKMPEPITADYRVIHTVLLFLKYEFDLAEAIAKYKWKVTEPTMDPDLFQGIKTIAQESAVMDKAMQAVELWTELAMELSAVTNTTCLHYALHLAQILVQQLLHVGSIVYGLQLAHVCCKVAAHIDDKEAYLRNAGVLLYHIDRQTDALTNITAVASRYWTALIREQVTMETAVIYLCNMATHLLGNATEVAEHRTEDEVLQRLCHNDGTKAFSEPGLFGRLEVIKPALETIHYSKCGFEGSAARLVRVAQAKILDASARCPDVNLDLAVGRLLEVQTLLCRATGASALSATSGLQRYYLAVPTISLKWSARRLRSSVLKYHTAVASALSAQLARALLLWSRARAATGAALPTSAARSQATLYTYITDVHKMQDAQVKIDNRLKFILGLQASTDQRITTEESKPEPFTPKQDFETMLDTNIRSQLSPTLLFKIPRFQLPDQFTHTDCSCKLCDMKSLILITSTIGLEAAMYFRAKEYDIAENYYSGLREMFRIIQNRFKCVWDKYNDLEFEGYIMEFAKKLCENEFRVVQLESFVEMAFFEMESKNFDGTNECIVTIHEILQDMTNVDPYLSNEIMNLMVASAEVRKVVKEPELCELITDFDALKVTVEPIEVPRTPESKPLVVQTIANKVVKDEEILKKRKVIKLNLDETTEDPEKPGRRSGRSKKSEFKIPGPITRRPALECITPKVTKKPDIVVTDVVETPNAGGNPEFFTPQSTPEQFFTPMTSLKTYSRSLRQGIVKNLEQEFGTPKANKENADKLEAPNSKSRANNRALKRATSPGKLERKPTRSSVKPPTNFNLDDK